MELAIKIIIDSVKQNGIAGDRIDYVLDFLVKNADLISSLYEDKGANSTKL